VRSIASLLQSSALEPIPACMRAYARLVRSCVRARFSDKPQRACAIDRTSVVIERTCIDCYISASLSVYDRSQCPVLERIFVDCTNILEAVYMFSSHFFVLFNF
jgi:hypothetical protein